MKGDLRIVIWLGDRAEEQGRSSEAAEEQRRFGGTALVADDAEGTDKSADGSPALETPRTRH